MSGPAPGSAEWLRFMTASKIAAVVGTSPYESRFSLWHRMAGNLPLQEETAPMKVGNVLEPALLAWFQSQHPEFVVVPGRWETHHAVTWAGATPDGYALATNGTEVEGLIEAKTARESWEWQDEQVPPGYYDQCQWQMWVAGVDVTYVAALVSMELVERVVRYDTRRVRALVAAATEFMESLATRTPPPLDGSTHTYDAVRVLNPDIDPVDAEVPTELAHRFLDAHHEAERWTDAERQAKAEIAALMGSARRARWNGQTLFTRQAKNGGVPYLVAARNLPTLGDAA